MQRFSTTFSDPIMMAVGTGTDYLLRSMTLLIIFRLSPSLPLIKQLTIRRLKLKTGSTFISFISPALFGIRASLPQCPRHQCPLFRVDLHGGQWCIRSERSRTYCSWFPRSTMNGGNAAVSENGPAHEFGEKGIFHILCKNAGDRSKAACQLGSCHQANAATIAQHV